MVYNEAYLRMTYTPEQRVYNSQVLLPELAFEVVLIASRTSCGPWHLSTGGYVDIRMWVTLKYGLDLLRENKFDKCK